MIEIVNPIEIYERILMGKPYGKNLIPYTKRVLLNVVEQLSEIEEYEKCRELSDFIKMRFNHKSLFIL